MDREPYIRRRARQLGLDPDAVVAIANVEGQSALHGGRSVGDHGTSFGPFQLHEGGALPAGRGSGWAHSKAGIDYALRQMAGVAGGLHGRAAVSAISSRFERPADVPGEIAKALTYYGRSGGAGAGGPAPVPPGPAVHARPKEAGSAGFRKELALALLKQVGQQNPDYSQVFDVLRSQRNTPVTQPSVTQPRVPTTVAPRSTPRSPGGINELFYDPLGGIKKGQQVGAIGHHNDHVHVALPSLPAQLRAEQHARNRGLHVGEERDSDFHNVHAPNSYHNVDYPGTHHREAADVSGTPGQMSAYYKWVARTFGGKR